MADCNEEIYILCEIVLIHWEVRKIFLKFNMIILVICQQVIVLICIISAGFCWVIPSSSLIKILIFFKEMEYEVLAETLCLNIFFFFLFKILACFAIPRD
jgi:hypothetical protein